jgi:hypothetical protein
MSKLCKRQNCMRLGTSLCSACQHISYCCVDCQRANWKEHKITCGKKLLTENELNKFLVEKTHEASSLDLADGTGRSISVLQGAVLFVEYQLGDQVSGECFRRLKSGIIFENDWPLFALRGMLTQCYISQHTVASYDVALGYATETRARVEMRRSNRDDRNRFFHFIYRVNSQLGDIFLCTLRLGESLYHMQEALTAARHYECAHSENNSNLFYILKNLAQICSMLKNGESAKYAEEAYILVSSQEGPEHPHVQDAASFLIQSYMDIGNFVDAERLARITYECLIDPNNKFNPHVIAIGKYQIATLWVHTPPDQRIGGPEAAEEAETLARDGCFILENILRGGIDVKSDLTMTYCTLCKVMEIRGKKDVKVEKVLLRALSLTHECRVGEVPRVQSSVYRYYLLRQLASVYFALAADPEPNCYDCKLLSKSKCAYEECVVLARVLFDTDDDRLLHCIKLVREHDEFLKGAEVMIRR